MNFINLLQTAISNIQLGRTILQQPTQINARQDTLVTLSDGTQVHSADVHLYNLAQAVASQNSNTPDLENLPLGEGMQEVFDEYLSPHQQATLNSLADNLIDKYKDGKVSHTEIGMILDEIAAMDNLTDIEKAYLWTQIADSKGVPGFLHTPKNHQDGDYDITNGGVNPSVIDDGLFMENTTLIHTVVGFLDELHARLGGPEGDNGAAEEEIADREFTWIPSIVPAKGNNPGDYEASMAMINAFRAFREGGFDDFAAVWKEGMLTTDAQIEAIENMTDEMNRVETVDRLIEGLEQAQLILQQELDDSPIVMLEDGLEAQIVTISQQIARAEAAR